MVTIALEWLQFPVNLQVVGGWLKANAGSFYLGISGNTNLQIHFSSKPADNVISAIKNYWIGLNGNSPEHHYVSKNAIITKINELKTGLISKTWDNMSVAERKIVIGQTPTLSELGL